MALTIEDRDRIEKSIADLTYQIDQLHHARCLQVLRIALDGATFTSEQIDSYCYSLSERERHVFIHRLWSPSPYTTLTLSETAATWCDNGAGRSMTRERARQIEQLTLMKLRKWLMQFSTSIDGTRSMYGREVPPTP